MRIVTFVLLLSLGLSSVTAQSGINKCGGTYYSSEYEPQKILSLDELPSHIQNSLAKYLEKKLGKAFCSILKLNGGLIIDYQELIKKDSNVLNYQWTIPKYDLSFYLSKSYSGINFYCSRITLDSSGDVITDLRFPSISQNNKNTSFVKLKTIKKVAKENGFKCRKYSVDVTDGHLTLKFMRSKKYKYIEYLEISVHTGKVVNRSKITNLISWE